MSRDQYFKVSEKGLVVSLFSNDFMDDPKSKVVVVIFFLSAKEKKPLTLKNYFTEQWPVT